MSHTGSFNASWHDVIARLNESFNQAQGIPLYTTIYGNRNQSVLLYVAKLPIEMLNNICMLIDIVDATSCRKTAPYARTRMQTGLTV